MRAVALAARRALLCDDLPLMEWTAAELLRLAALDKAEGVTPALGQLLLHKWVAATAVGGVFEQRGQMYLDSEQDTCVAAALLKRECHQNACTDSPSPRSSRLLLP
jgi:hypothetical protein